QEINQIPREESASSSGSVAISNDGSRALTWAGWGSEGLVHVWDTSMGTELFRFGMSEGIYSAKFGPADALIFTVGKSGTLHIRKAADGSILRELAGHQGAISTFEFSKNGEQVVTGSWDGTARVWDISTGRELARLTGHRDQVSYVGVSDDGK